MKIVRTIGEFRKREDGSLLIFFVISIVAVLGIVALSFDMGRRASTQSDMQSFADNVALAAAGELDGQADAITRARAAAQNAINAANETLKAGASGTTQQLTFNPTTDLIFYTTLPAIDTPGSFAVADLSNPSSTSYKYALPTSNITTDPTRAVYVGVRLTQVPVNWLFANIFGSGLIISPNIGAVAISGNTAFTCDIAPLMFCLPRETDADGVSHSVYPLPGTGVRLQSVGQNSAWNPGEFGFLDVNWLQANAEASAPCTGMTPESRFQACLLARGIGACFNNRRVDVQTGQRAGQEGAAFNLPFGFVGQAMNNLMNGQNAAYYATGPHTISGIDAGGGCNSLEASTDTMPFPLDDCQRANTCGRFGDRDWSGGRSEYVTTNYTLFDGAGEETVPGEFFDFDDTSLTRYQYYLREIARARDGGLDNGVDTQEEPYGSWTDYWDPAINGQINPILPLGNNRADDGLPQCNVPASDNADRRVMIAAGIDCPPGLYHGTVPSNVPVAQYYRVFQLAPARDVPGSGTGNSDPIYQIDIEIIEEAGGEAGGSTVDAGIFREVIQLYK